MILMGNIMNREIFMVKGASGSGKSTRYLYLIRFLKHIGFKFHEEFYTNINGEKEKIGIVCDDLQLFFLGKISDKTGLWRGMDDSLDIFIKIDYLFDFIRVKLDDYSFCIEGSSVTRSFRFRPIYFSENLGITSGILQYYNFDSKDNFSKRKFIRSGKVGENGWDANNSFIGDFNKSMEEISSVNIDLDIYNDNFDAPVYDIGCKVLRKLEAGFLESKFIEYCNENFK